MHQFAPGMLNRRRPAHQDEVNEETQTKCDEPGVRVKQVEEARTVSSSTPPLRETPLGPLPTQILSQISLPSSPWP